MTPFTTLTAIAAPLPEADVDTDVIYPARFLLRTEKQGLGRCAFHDKRFAADGSALPGFVLNRAPWQQARMLVAGPNFGCGSSREQAPWALADLGLRCIIAPGFGEIFRANCFANGLLPIVLGAPDHARAMREAGAARPLTVDLAAGTITLSGPEAGAPIRFEVPARQREALLAGLDEIAMIQRDQGARIAAFEQRQRERMPWLTPPAPSHPTAAT